MDREVAFNLVKKYNEEPFHIRHALTVEGAMKYFARKNNEDENFWGCVGLLHDVDFEKWPEEHCKKAPELLKEIGCSDEMIHANTCHYKDITKRKPHHNSIY